MSVVIDSGLVRRTRYDRGRGALTLVEIAQDSAGPILNRSELLRIGPKSLRTPPDRSEIPSIAAQFDHV